MSPNEHAHLEADVLRQVVVEAAAELDRLDDRREVVVGEDHRRGLLRDLRAGDAHRDADVGALQRRRVVHAVAGHRDDVALAPQRVDEPHLVLRRDPGDDADVVDLRDQLVVAHRAELGARDRAARDAELPRDRCGGDGVVARDHPHLDAGLVRLAIASFAVGRGGSTMPTSASTRQPVEQGQQVGVRVERRRVEVLARRRQHAQALLAEALVLVLYRCLNSSSTATGCRSSGSSVMARARAAGPARP